ncbi:MAG: hypothetical protein L0191_00155 [Acidobacteria bacterium]|nr:hypothetical protein [Acidobacteriota bacterium]
MSRKLTRLVRLNGRIFLWAVVLNFLWEMAQAYAYSGMPPSSFEATLMCGRASLIDGLLVLGIFWGGVVVFSRVGWAERPGLAGYFFMVAAGFLVSVIIELNAVYRLGKWGYQEMMPLLPPWEVGVLPVLQMLLLPPVIFLLSRRKSGRKKY